MDLKKLPSSMVLMLGLACTDQDTLGPCLSPATTDDGSSPTVGPCLDVDPSVTSEVGTSGSGTTSIGSTDTGSTGADSTVGPCLSPPEPSTGTDTGTDTGTGTDTDTGTGTDTDGTTGMMNDAPPPSRAAALERVLERGVLPPDVAARLRDRSR